jgi:hypothetical protein
LGNAELPLVGSPYYTYEILSVPVLGTLSSRLREPPYSYRPTFTGIISKKMASAAKFLSQRP